MRLSGHHKRERWSRNKIHIWVGGGEGEQGGGGDGGKEEETRGRRMRRGRRNNLSRGFEIIGISTTLFAMQF